MRGLRIGILLAGTAIAVVFAARTVPAAAANSEKAIESMVPVPDTSLIAPPTASDLSAPATTQSTTPPAATGAPAAAPTTTQSTTPPTTTTLAPAAVAAPTVASADQPIADKLRDELTGKTDHIIDHKNKAAVDAFYAARGYAPLWIENGSADARAKAVATFLSKVDADGLDPADYPLPEIKAGADASALADAELKTTETVLTYARHAQIGRVHFSRISGDILFNLVPPEAADVLGGVVDTTDVAAALERFEPPHEGYKLLKAKLAEIRGVKGDAAPSRIDSGPVLKLVAKTPMQDPRVPMLRERLGVSGQADDTTYDKEVADAVKKFQESHKLAASGQLTAQTVAAINGPKHDHDADIIVANMERWRWLPHDLGNAYVMVNIPDYTLKVMKDGAQVWKTKIVTGGPGQHATPLLTETMKYITVNPTWNVPPSIINNEYLPALAQDPTVLDRMGLKVERNHDGTVRIYQPPGAANALGRIRFNFPNKFLVYQHDTPDKYLFAHDVRDYSHGCMRVQDPDRYAEVLLSITNPGEGYTVDRIRKMYGSGEVDIHMKTPIPVHVTYQTAYVDDNGKLVIRDDIYGRDAKYFALMKGEERKVADIPTENHDTVTVTRAPRMPDNVAFGSNTGGGGGSGLFGWIFGGGPVTAPRAQVLLRPRTYQR